MSAATALPKGPQTHSLQTPMSSVAHLPTELWTKIISIVLLPDLHTRTTTNVLPLLLVSKVFKAFVISTQEFQYLRNARLRVQNTVFTSAHKLFRVGKGHPRVQVSGQYVAALPGGPDVKAFTTEMEFEWLRRDGIASVCASLDPKVVMELLASGDFHNEKAIQAARDWVAFTDAEVAKTDSFTRRMSEIVRDKLKSFDAMERTSIRVQSNLPILQTLPDLPKTQTTVVVRRFCHGSEPTDFLLDTMPVTWGERVGHDWDVNFLGSAEYLYWLCKEGRDLKVPQRRVSDDDYDAKERAIIYEKFIEWYEKGKLDETKLWID
ncbi:hypothetical protein HDV00_009663 [Rhizophlyctis rosea]|nr:hypothetical protein HDV00_009663 [Rhizophlyctis rosea]